MIVSNTGPALIHVKHRDPQKIRAIVELLKTKPWAATIYTAAEEPAGGAYVKSPGDEHAFGAFTPGVAKDYTAATTATVVSSAGDAALSVADPSTTAPGHLVNGTFAVPAALQVNGGALGVLKTWPAPVSNEVVTVAFKQLIAAADALRTGTYAKALTFSLSTTTP